ncbi:MAG TPA: (5-formylfuran-3-yl)methyl phosphate synthase [Solirubrobacteraceae bacterium]|nr:(5-formylfuran-3-yl)methyl phosphate synthase [Solirubrobacteraceae bacterium]
MRLLVSVVSGEEAQRALTGGADIIDVKDPGEGALGAPAPRVLSDVVRAVGTSAPVSVALGDLPDLPHTAALAARGAALSGAGYVKVGLRGVRDLERGVAMMRAVAEAVEVSGGRVSVIAAAYADAAALDPPALAPACLPALVERTGIAGALVDTFVKDGRGLYAWMSEAELAGLIGRTHRSGAIFAVAGQLRPGELCRVAADVVGVRSAVCREGDRRSELRADLVAAAVTELRAGSHDQPATIRVPVTGLDAGPDAGRRTTTATPVRRTASGM